MKYTDQQVKEWADRHGVDLNDKDLRCAFEDAATTHLLENPASAACSQPETPLTDKLKAKGIEWVPIGRMEDIERRCSQLREALDRIARPVWWMQEDQRRKTGSINGVSGQLAISLANNADYLRGIAKSALENTDPQPGKTL